MGYVQRIVEDDAIGRSFTIVVAVANPANVEQLMRTAVDVAADHDGGIRVVHVVHKPTTSPFVLFSADSLREEFAAGREAVLNEAVAFVEAAGVPVGRSLLVGTDVSEALISEVDHVDADALLLGWQDATHPADAVLGTTIDPVVRRAPCDVFVERVGTTADGMDAILAPTDGGPHLESAADLAGAVARANGASVRVVSYVPPDAGAPARSAAHEHVEAIDARLSDVPVDAAVREAVDVADAIVAAAEDNDLVVLGATRERRFRGRVVGTVAETVGRHATPPIVIAKRRSGGSLLERVFGGSLLERVFGGSHLERALDRWWL